MQKLGFELEKQIHDKLSQYKELTCYRENEIKQMYNLYGVDHLIIYNNIIICIQDKWECKTPSVRDINHFIQTAITIQTKYNNSILYGIFASKKPCSKTGLESLNRYKFKNIFTNIMSELVDNIEQDITNICKLVIAKPVLANIPIIDNKFELIKQLIREIIAHHIIIRNHHGASNIDIKYTNFDIADKYHEFQFRGIQEYLYEKSQEYYSLAHNMLYEIYNCYTKLLKIRENIDTVNYPYMKKWEIKPKYRIYFNPVTISYICYFGYGGEYAKYGEVHFKKIIKMSMEEIASVIQKAGKSKKRICFN
jgi:hypothetical protein